MEKQVKVLRLDSGSFEFVEVSMSPDDKALHGKSVTFIPTGFSVDGTVEVVGDVDKPYLDVLVEHPNKKSLTYVQMFDYGDEDSEDFVHCSGVLYFVLCKGGSEIIDLDDVTKSQIINSVKKDTYRGVPVMFSTVVAH